MTHLQTLRAAGLSLLAVSAFAASAPASAQSQSDPVRVTVSYADLNIDRPQGAKVLLQRIQVAADRACGGAPDLRLLTERANYDRCRAHAVAAAITAVNSPTLAAMAGRTTDQTRLAGR